MTTHLETLERTNGSPGLDGFSDRGAECAPIIERTDTKELDEGIDLLYVILPIEPLVSLIVQPREPFDLHRSTSKTPPELRVESTTRDRCLRVAVLNVMRLVYPAVSA